MHLSGAWLEKHRYVMVMRGRTDRPITCVRSIGCHYHPASVGLPPSPLPPLACISSLNSFSECPCRRSVDELGLLDGTGVHRVVAET